MEQHMVEFTTSLDERLYRKTIYWNLFCKRKWLFFIFAAMYGYGMITIGFTFRITTEYTGEVVRSLAVSFLCMILPIISLLIQERRVRKTIKTRDISRDTEKNIHMSSQYISIFRVEKQEKKEYTWKDVAGVYDVAPRVIICMNDGQMFLMNPNQTTAKDREWVMKVAKENQVIKRAMKSKSLKLALIIITAISMIIVGNS